MVIAVVTGVAERAVHALEDSMFARVSHKPRTVFNGLWAVIRTDPELKPHLTVRQKTQSDRHLRPYARRVTAAARLDKFPILIWKPWLALVTFLPGRRYVSRFLKMSIIEAPTNGREGGTKNHRVFKIFVLVQPAPMADQITAADTKGVCWAFDAFQRPRQTVPPV